MTDTEYLQVAESLLQVIEHRCDRINDDSDIDLDVQRVGTMLTLTFADQSQIIINLQKPLQEVWLASKGGGFHYKFDGADWRDTKSGNEFFAQLSQDASMHAKSVIHFVTG